MPKLPIISGQTAVRAFMKIGYQIIRQRGSHIRLHHKTRKPLTIPNHKILGKGLIRKLLRDAQISIEEFIKLI
ncbi:MAG TPA: type II toxin-antitoxin system HicA family toxin [Candidatus Nanoarchaeia archaeon]|nr:type II toxin-antitoxin system HicA family toxin [Candidatus Nanoarchaeia archaeon]